jgi:hydroxymethylglutaryl-CoA reductase (NADPH)
MHTTFIRLFLSSRALGSNFWLTTAILSSSVLAFMLALPIARYLRIPLEPVSLIEALPFLVCTVGFEKPLRLARAVFSHPHAVQPAVNEGRQRGRMKPAPELIRESLDRVGNAILRDYALEVAVLFIGARSRVGGLKEFCALAALLLTIDCLTMMTFYVAILSIMIEVRAPRRLPDCRAAADIILHQVRRIKMFRAMSRSRRPSLSDIRPALAPLRLDPHHASVAVPALSLRTRTSAALLGVKGSFLRDDADANKDNTGAGTSPTGQSPVARLKLLLIVSFLTLHLLNLCAPLAPATPPAPLEELLGARRVDLSAPPLARALAALAAAHTANSSAPLLVRVAPPIVLRALPLPTRVGEEGALEGFMSAWTRLVGDPILSKWIVLLLGVSVALNGYLLKGIATGTGSTRSVVPFAGQSVRFSAPRSPAEKAEARADADTEGTARREETHRQLLEPEPRREELVPAPKVVIQPSPAPAPAPAPEPTPAPVFEPAPMPVLRPEPVRAPAPRVRSVNGISSMLDSVGARLSTLAQRADGSSSSEDEEGKDGARAATRSLAECVEVFENGPRPASAALATLTDEEVILLAQAGKIQAYALEKVLGDLERAVFVRRALICAFFFVPCVLWCVCANDGHSAR